MLVRPKQSQGRYSTRVRLGDEELGFVEEFRYLVEVMTVDFRDDKDIKKTIQEVKYSWQYAGQEVRIYTYGGKYKIVQVVCYPIYGCALWRHSYQNSIIEKLLSVIVTHANDLLMSPDRPAQAWHLR